MTVKELMEILEDVPADVEVAFCSEACDFYEDALEVEKVLRVCNLTAIGDDRIILVGK